MTTAPTAGRKTMRVSAHESNQFIEPIPLRLREDPQGQGEQPHRGDEHQCVELQAPGLDAGGPRRRASPVTVAETVDDAVDTLAGRCTRT